MCFLAAWLILFYSLKFLSLPLPSTGPAVFSERRACVPAGPVNFSTSAQLVAPAVVVKGTLSITNCELYFEVDEDEPSFRAIDPKVGKGTGLH